MNLSNYSTEFFKGFEMQADVSQGHSYKVFMKEAVSAFLKNESTATAFDVYETFFDCYRIKLKDSVTFSDLLDMLLSYEEQASVLLDKQRDHYIHSVNVFILGLAIYAQNDNFASSFIDNLFSRKYDGAFASPHEEFLFRWGLASLFHDIGYPVEITFKQLKKFVEFVSGVDGKVDTKPYVGYGFFDGFDSIEEIIWREDFSRNAFAEAPDDVKIDCYRPVDLLAFGISKSMSVDLGLIKNALGSYLSTMQSNGFVDHGFYSAIILLKWYGFLIQKSMRPPEILFNPVLNAACAILLHNCYKNMLMKPPFSLGRLAVDSDPISYLLILCDELQEWNRTAYGEQDRNKILPHATEIEINNEMLAIHYYTSKGVMAQSFADSKCEQLSKILHLESVFDKSIAITCTTPVDLYIEDIFEREGDYLPRPLLENLEQMAKAIHESYNMMQLKRNPDRALEYPTWEGLQDTLKFSNIRQAKGVFEKLRKVGLLWFDEAQIAEGLSKGLREVHSFSEEQVEYLARIEHERWKEERYKDGWVYGPVRDAERKTSPYLVPSYDMIPEEIKEYDRDAVRNVFALLASIGMRVFKRVEQ